MTETVHAAETVEQFDARIGQDNMIGQWTFEPLLNSVIGGPRPLGVGYVWPWQLARQRLEEASQALGPAGVGRCNLTFQNPGIERMPKGTTHTISAGVQIMRAHEVCWSHRHSMSALRFVIEGHPEAYTAVDGEELNMEQFDLILTPRFSWHDHHNPTGQEIVWLDVLDIGLTMAVNAPFYETYGQDSQPLRPGAAESQPLRAGHWLRPAWERPRHSRLPLRYKWSDVVQVLDAYGDSPGDQYEGLALQYVNPVTGGPTMSTMDCWVQQLAPGFAGRAHRRTSSSIGFVISGHGSIEVEGKVLPFGPGDTYAVPNYAWYSLRNDSEEPVRIFSVHDIPAIQALGLFYEEPEPTLHATPAPQVPAQPLHPVYRPAAMLDGDETR
jgi:gentisate 1,2-dioxygenase